MRRDQIILLIQVYKNGLMPKKDLTETSNRFARLLLGLCDKYPRVRLNVAMPGYILESVDRLVSSQLRDAVKRGGLEWLCMGYTEPFLSFSPQWLTGENIAAGVAAFSELTGEKPIGFVPPFSNWEPSHIDLLNAAGIKYSVVSNTILAENEADSSGFWITEYTGSSMAVFPARTYHRHSAPQSVMEWIKETYPENDAPEEPAAAPKMLILKYLYSLEWEWKYGGGEQRLDQRKWIENIVADIDKHILELQPLRFKDVIGNTPPLGLHYFPSSLVMSRGKPASPYFLNQLHCYDQLSVMQRKLMDVCDSVRDIKEPKLAAKLTRSLFFAQDINRFLPTEYSGFSSITDRLWTYGRLIDIEREFQEFKDATNGVIQLTEFLRNGYKSVIMSNGALKLYLDHRNGAQVYELDYQDRSFNACAAYNPRVRPRANVIAPRESHLAFSDKIFAGETAGYDDYISGSVKDCANFTGSAFEYTFKNSPTGVKILMNCNGGFIDGGRDCPLTMDKVFGLEKDLPSLSYSYKLGNTSLTDYAFTFGIEIPLALPGWAPGNARVSGKKIRRKSGDKVPIIMTDTAHWEIKDETAGVRIEFVTQKNVDVWIFPADADIDDTGSNGVIVMILYPVKLEKSSTILFPGRITFSATRARGNHDTL